MSTFVKLGGFDSGRGLADCSTTAGCAEAAAISIVWLILWVGGSSLILFAKQVNIAAAKSVLESERQRVADEHRSFKEFARRVDSIVPTPLQTPEPAGTLLTDGDDSLKRVREAYRETVMAVPHYEEDYGEPLGQHMANELGEDVAAAVVDGDGVPPGLPAALVGNCNSAMQMRKRYLTTLDTERQRLDDGAKSISSVAEACERLDDRHLRTLPFTDLHDRWNRLGEQRRTLEAILTEHQQRVQQELPTAFRVTGRLSFFEYLYRDLEVNFPVLADATDVKRELDRIDHRLTSAIAGRP